MTEAATRPERVLMTADTVGGVWSYAVELCRALEPFGVRVALATMGAPLSPAQWREAAALPNVRVFESSFRLEWMDEPWADVEAAGEWLLGVERAFGPDLIHLNGYAHGALPWKAPVLMVGHSCVCSWFAAVKRGEAPESWARYRQEVAQGLRSADLVTAPSEAMLRALRIHYGPFTAGPVVYNGRRAVDFPPGQKEPIILSAGRLWDEAKNVGLLTRAADRLPWPVYVAGEEAHPDHHGAAAMDGAVRLGRLAPERLAEWMGRASLYVLPARYEPFGLSALEAALAGCALVLGDIPSLREVWGEAAVYVAPDDEEGLVAAVSRLAGDDVERQRMASLARARALTYSPERMARGYLALYESLLPDRVKFDVSTQSVSLPYA